MNTGLVPTQRAGESDLAFLRRKELSWGLWQADALERFEQQDQTIDALKTRLAELERTLSAAKEMAQALASLVIGGTAQLKPDDLARDLCGHINLMGGLGDPDYLKGALTCRHVDLRTQAPRKSKAAA